ncbi:unnamed protein product [Taenia asiatica]|uniref:Uncharacterized protein n=1 Tax=Taenia asiatica TaxID=60517 RepID=A0A3P6QBL0_TAEAS|nr:unnamed protein product [Taenia asiatica]
MSSPTLRLPRRTAMRLACLFSTELNKVTQSYSDSRLICTKWQDESLPKAALGNFFSYIHHFHAMGSLGVAYIPGLIVWNVNWISSAKRSTL